MGADEPEAARGGHIDRGVSVRSAQILQVRPGQRGLTAGGFVTGFSPSGLHKPHTGIAIREQAVGRTGPPLTARYSRPILLSSGRWLKALSQITWLRG
jgi:hypothetical protein